MTNICVDIDDRLLKDFQEQVIKIHGLKHGGQKQCYEDALRLWLRVKNSDAILETREIEIALKEMEADEAPAQAAADYEEEISQVAPECWNIGAGTYNDENLKHYSEEIARDYGFTVEQVVNDIKAKLKE